MLCIVMAVNRALDLIFEAITTLIIALAFALARDNHALTC
jgi:hypothetical protein